MRKKINLHDCDVDQFLKGMSGDLFQGQMSESSVRSTSKRVNSTLMQIYHNKIIKLKS